MGHQNFPVAKMGRNEILVELDSKNFPGKFYYRMIRAKESDRILDYCIESLGSVFGLFNKPRVPASTRLYKNFVNNAKVGIAMAGEPLSQNLWYKVTNINPTNRSAHIEFLTPGHEYEAELLFDSKWHVNKTMLQSSLKESTTLADNKARIDANTERILQYKKDKRRGKLVKNYEKLLKKIQIPETFTTLTEYNDLVKLQNEMLKIQEETIRALE